MKCQGLGSVHVGLAEARSWSQDAIAYAWLIDDAFMYAIAAGAGDDASTDDPCSPACIDTLQPFLGDDIRLCRGAAAPVCPCNLGEVQCTVHRTSPPPKPIDAKGAPLRRLQSIAPRMRYPDRRVRSQCPA